METNGVISVDKQEAKAKLKELRATMHGEVDEQWKTLERFYVHAGQGRKVIDISRAFQAAPVDDKGRPMLAIARAHASECQMRWYRNQTTIKYASMVTDKNYTRGYREFNDNLVAEIGRRPLGARNKAGELVDPYSIDGWAVLPVVPPDIRRKFHTLNGLHIMWEVPEWGDKSALAIPVDPFLLKRVTGNLYAIYAEWEITEVERQVLQAARVL